MKTKLWLLSFVPVLLLLPTAVLAQDAHAATAMPAVQSVSASLATMPDADVLIYVSPQRILNEAAPRLMPAKELSEMRSMFADMKQAVGVDPSAVDYLVIALRFHKPAADLSFVAPDIMAVAGGDFNADSLFSLAQLTLQSKVRLEKHGSKTIALMKIDPIAAQAEKTPMLKSLSEIGAVPLSANSLAIGNLPYLKSAIEAAEGAGRINPATLESLMRDPNALIAASGTPLASVAKAFGLSGTEATARESRCETPFGNFYAAVSMSFKPDEYEKYLPGFVTTLIDIRPAALLQSFALFEGALAAWLISGRATAFAGGIAAITMLLIIGFNLREFDELFRNVAIASGAAALAIHPSPKRGRDAKWKKAQYQRLG